MSALLALLMSENREKLLASEKARIRKYLERLGTILNQERGIEGRTAGGGEPQGLAEEQAKLAGKTGDLAKDIKANEENGAKPGAGKQGAGKQGAGKQASREQGAGKQGSKEQGSKGQGAGKPGDSKPGTGKPGAGKPGEGKPGEGEPGDSQSGEDQKQDQDNPARKRLEAAQQKMREAEENLKEGAVRGGEGQARGSDPGASSRPKRNWNAFCVSSAKRRSSGRSRPWRPALPRCCKCSGWYTTVQ